MRVKGQEGESQIKEILMKPCLATPCKEDEEKSERKWCVKGCRNGNASVYPYIKMTHLGKGELASRKKPYYAKTRN